MNIPEGFVLVPADPIKAIDMGWAYLDAARDAEPGKDWAFSHAGYRAMIAAAPAPVEIACRDDGRCEYAIQSGAEGNGHCPDGKCAMPASAPGTGSDTLDCILGVGGFASFGPLDAQPAHLTIPGALEWDGDNGTHGVVGTHSADGESDFDDAKEACAEVERTGSPGDVIREMNDELVDLRAQLDDYKSKWLAKCEALKILGIHARHAEKLVKSCREKLEVDSAGKGFIEALDGFISALGRDDNTHGESEIVPSAYTAVDMTTAAAGGFRDGQAELHAVLNQAYMALIGYLPGHRNDLTDAAIAACSAILFPVEAKAACSRCGGWGHIETEDSAYDCPECGPSVVDRAVEAGVMNAPKLYAADDIPDFTPGSGNKARRRIEAIQKAKPKTCIECDQPYCHGVCVERGDQDYDRDQAAKGGDDE